MAESLNMRAMEADGQYEESNWYELRPLGTQPQRRGYHSSFIYQNKMFIFGGNDIRVGLNNNLWSVDLSAVGDLQQVAGQPNNAQVFDDMPKLEWKAVPTKGSVPPPIAHHRCIVTGKNMYLIGGTMMMKDYQQTQIYRLDLQTYNWD